MKAIKENKVYTITEQQQELYLAQGYNIEDDEGNIIKHSTKATVPYAEYEEVKKELDKLKAGENADNKDVIDILCAFAHEHGIDLGKATTIAGIVKKIKEHEPEGSE